MRDALAPAQQRDDLDHACFVVFENETPRQ
jgi:hypothetical protein